MAYKEIESIPDKDLSDAEVYRLWRENEGFIWDNIFYEDADKILQETEKVEKGAPLFPFVVRILEKDREGIEARLEYDNKLLAKRSLQDIVAWVEDKKTELITIGNFLNAYNVAVSDPTGKIPDAVFKSIDQYINDSVAPAKSQFSKFFNENPEKKGIYLRFGDLYERARGELRPLVEAGI